MQVDDALSARVAGLPAPVAVDAALAFDAERTAVVDGVFPGGDAVADAGKPHDRLEGGTRRVKTAGGAVEERRLPRRLEFVILRRADAGDEEIGVVTGLAEEREDAAGAGFDGHHRAAAVAECGGGGALQAGVEVQGDVRAGASRLLEQGPHLPPSGIDFDATMARLAVQRVLVELFHAVPADERGGRIAGLFEPLEIGLVDAPHRADGMRHLQRFRVMPHDVGAHLHARQAKLVHAHRGALSLVDVELQWDRFERPSFGLEALVETRDVRFSERHQRAHLRQQGIDVAGEFRNHRNRVDGAVAGQQVAIAVIDEAAPRRHGHRLHPVAVRAGAIGVGLEHLKLHHASEQHEEGSGHQHHADGGTRIERALLLASVVQLLPRRRR